MFFGICPAFQFNYFLFFFQISESSGRSGKRSSRLWPRSLRRISNVEKTNSSVIKSIPIVVKVSGRYYYYLGIIHSELFFQLKIMFRAWGGGFVSFEQMEEINYVSFSTFILIIYQISTIKLRIIIYFLPQNFTEVLINPM